MKGSRWPEIAAVFADELVEHYGREGADPTTPAAESTLRTNSDLVPRRAELVLGWLRDLHGDSLRGKRVLEMGCGFGALACYIAYAEEPAEVVAADFDERMLEVAQRATARAACGAPLTVVNADMRDLSRFGDDSFDAILLNNSFIYLATAQDQARALRELARVLAPDGPIVIYNANKWQLREPFTGAPMAHLLGPRLAGRLGLRHSHGRVRLVSPPQLRRQLRAAGFAAPRLLLQPNRKGMVGRYLTPFYGVGALGPRRS